ncbi:MAG: CoA-substrate-specific enzyme activase [Desulfotomaculum sp. 46_296]|nr:MAG: CoA-substrate-specific enzyme activase [Desulfotomaculum sp. 46_296]
MENLYVDTACSYVPLEIIHTMGFTPRRLLAPEPKETGLMPRNYCSYARACVYPSGTVPVVFTTCCDGMRRCYDIRKSRGDTVFLLDLPRHLSNAHVEYYGGELRRLARWLGELSGIAVPKRLSSRQPLLKKSPKETTTACKKTIILSGAVLPDDGILQLINEYEATAIKVDFCTEQRSDLEAAYSEKEDEFLSLARAYLSKPPCPRMTGRRFPYIRELIEQTGARGVILYTIKFCDHGLYEIPLWRYLCSGLNIPFLHLEGEYKSGMPAQFHTRIQAFLETI